MHTSKCSFSEGFFPVWIWGYFLFQHSPQWAPKYLFEEHKITELANCSKKGMVELCVMKSHIRKQSLRKLLSSVYVSILPLSPWAAIGSQVSLCRIHDNSVSNLFQEGKGGTLCDEVTHQKAIAQKTSLWLSSEDIFFFTMGPYGLPSITLQNTRQQCQQIVPKSEGWNAVWCSHTSESNLSERFSVFLMWG